MLLSHNGLESVGVNVVLLWLTAILHANVLLLHLLVALHHIGAVFQTVIEMGHVHVLLVVVQKDFFVVDFHEPLS